MSGSRNTNGLAIVAILAALLFLIGAGTAPDTCPEGKHNGGAGECVAEFTCSPNFRLLESGLCAQAFAATEPPVYPWHPKAASLSDGRVFVLGFEHKNRVGPMAALVYDPAKNAWKQVAAPSSPRRDYHLAAPSSPRRDYHLAALGDGRIVVADGKLLDNDPIELEELIYHGRWTEQTDSVLVFDLEANEWKDGAAVDDVPKGPLYGRDLLKLRGVPEEVYSYSPDIIIRLGDGRIAFTSARSLRLYDPEDGTNTTLERIPLNKRLFRAGPGVIGMLDAKGKAELFEIVGDSLEPVGELHLATFEEQARWNEPEPQAPQPAMSAPVPGGALVWGASHRMPRIWRVVVDAPRVAGLDKLEVPTPGAERYAPLPLLATRPIDEMEVQLKTPAAVPHQLAAALDEGKPREWFEEQLQAELTYRKVDPKIVIADFDADGKDDLAAAYQSLRPKQYGWLGAIIWSDGNFSTLREFMGRGPTFYEPTDLTGDGVPELIYSIEECGAHTCFQLPEVLSAHGGGGMRPILAGHGNHMAQQVEIQSPDDGLAYLEFTSGWVGSAGAGTNQRGETNAWKWNPKTQLIEQVPAAKGGLKPDGASKTVMDRFGDALFALESRDKRAAWSAFEDILRDDDLPSGMDEETGETLRAQLRQLAFFELARIAIEVKDDKTLALVKKRLKRRFPDSPTSAAIDTLQARFRQTGSMALACSRNDKELFEGQWALLAHGYNPQVRPKTSFGLQYLCAGLPQPPSLQGELEVEALDDEHVSVSFEVDENDHRAPKLMAEACANGCSDDCEPAELVYPSSPKFTPLSAGKAPQRDLLVWRVDCERAGGEAGLSLCLRPDEPRDHLLSEVSAPNGVCSQ